MPLRPALHRLSSLKTAALAGATALLLPVAAQAQQIYINTPVQLFAGPDTSYPVVAMLYPGLDVRVIGCLPSYEWCDILLSDGMRGWVFGESLSYPWRGNPLPVPQYGTTIGIPLITFSIGEYWGNHYRHQP
ncbi:MAG: SH3 domain-containing protein, partial [Zoogloea sp.]|nr:SH3 domain-containing protein [Zoogloea sp.]